jgi:hypothetical protein
VTHYTGPMHRTIEAILAAGIDANSVMRDGLSAEGYYARIPSQSGKGYVVDPSSHTTVTQFHEWPTTEIGRSIYAIYSRESHPAGRQYGTPPDTLIDGPATIGVLEEVVAERIRQDAKWGQQTHPDGTHPGYGLKADAAKLHCDRKAKDGSLTWSDILAEEFWEALAETDPTKLRAELLQVAAVAAAWVEDVDRRSALEIERSAQVETAA